MLNEAKVIVISSVSGGGKTSLIEILLKKAPALRAAVTATSRPPRHREVHGRHYFFYTKREFEEKIKKNDFLEYAEVHGNYYGVPLAPVQECLRDGLSVVLNIDVQGNRRVRQIMPERVISIFLMPPSLEVWEERLRKRGSDSEDVIQRRLAMGKEELKCTSEYDYTVVNDDLARATAEVLDIMKRHGL